MNYFKFSFKFLNLIKISAIIQKSKAKNPKKIVRMSVSQLSYQEAEVAGFVAKTFDILKNEEFSKVIFWGSSGKDFIIKDVNKFEEIVLPRYFRHRKINSFIRQLNMYGFHKSRKDNSKSIFSHPSFMKGREDLLSLIKRKIKGHEICLETPTQKKTVDPLKKSIQTAIKQSQPSQLLVPEPSKTILRQFLESRQHVDSRFHLNHSLHKLSIDDFEYKENIDFIQEDKVSIENQLDNQIHKMQDFGSFKKIMNPSMFFASFMEKNEEERENQDTENQRQIQ